MISKIKILKVLYTSLMFVCFNSAIQSQPAGAYINLYIVDDNGKSIFTLNNDSLICFEGKHYTFEVTGKNSNSYNVFFIKPFGGNSTDTLSIGFISSDSLCIKIQMRGKLKNMQIIIPEIKEGKEYFIYAIFKPKKYIIKKKKIEAIIQKSKNDYKIDLSQLIKT